MKRELTFLAGLLLATAALPPTARAERVTVYGGVQAFNWQEFAPDGAKLLEESGPLFAAGMRLEPTPRKTAPVLRVELFGGIVDYDGQRQNGEPVQDRTGYLGTDTFLGISLPLLKRGDQGLCAILGGGVRGWYRFIGIDDDQGGGYTEAWTLLRGRAGLGWYAMRGPELAWFAEAGVSLPVYTANRIDYDDLEDRDEKLEPEGVPGFYAEAGLTHGRLFLSAFVEADRYEESDPIARLGGIGTDGEPVEVLILQPESEQLSIGLRAGMTF